MPKINSSLSIQVTTDDDGTVSIVIAHPPEFTKLEVMGLLQLAALTIHETYFDTRSTVKAVYSPEGL